MKRSLIALAAMAAASAASAQSSVTLFGIIDTTLSHGSGSVSSKTQVSHSGYNSSRIGFRGTEDLGGGLSASFWLEAGINSDSGSGGSTNTNNQSTGSTGGGGLTFNRRSTVSLAGTWGELRLGRDYTPQFWNHSVFDPFGANGVGYSQPLYSLVTTVTQARASNTIGYFLPPNLGGVYGQAQYYLGENNRNGAANEKDGTGWGIRLGYAAGPLNVAAGYGRTQYAAGNEKQSNIGGAYNFGFGRLMLNYSSDSRGSIDGKGWVAGGLVPVGAGEIRFAYSRYQIDTAGDPTTKKLSLGYVHNLSKRTALYATWAHVSNSGGASFALNGAVTGPNRSSSGYDLGLRHSF